MSGIDSIISMAKSYYGTTEGSTAHIDLIRRYNSVRNPSAYEMTKNDPWCATFVVAIFALCGEEKIIPCYASCQQMISVFKKWERWASVKERTPERGDIIFYDWDKDGKSDHVGIVVTNTKGTLQVIEGNKSNSVQYRVVASDSKYIVGYGVPDYDYFTVVRTAPRYTSWLKYLSEKDRSTVKSLPVLKYNSTGIYVRIMQALLCGMGDSYIDCDGEFGPATKTSLGKWQKKMNLEQDYECGPETWASFFVNSLDVA